MDIRKVCSHCPDLLFIRIIEGFLVSECDKVIEVMPALRLFHKEVILFPAPDGFDGTVLHLGKDINRLHMLGKFFKILKVKEKYLRPVRSIIMLEPFSEETLDHIRRNPLFCLHLDQKTRALHTLTELLDLHIEDLVAEQIPDITLYVCLIDHIS
ncbi:hypothetical protein BMS3Bbin09_00457 [bacterium BMS3Bbin09]|nr:hypothetical protein BMS3Bbin09_00457 [bacterium BMS3Bbin09]